MPMSADILLAGRLRREIRSCTRCDLSSPSSSPSITPVPFRGDIPARLMVVGEAPGRDENAAGEPFVGVSGRLLTTTMARAGIEIGKGDGVAFANTVSCFPNRTPSTREVTACAPNLLAQITIVRPSIIVLVGGIALSPWWKELRIGDARGRWFQMEESSGIHGIAIATWHPAAILRNRSLYRDFLLDWVEVGRVLRGRMASIDRSCVLCGGLDDDEVWVGAGDRGLGVDITEKGGGVGIAFCRKHWDHRVKTLGTILFPKEKNTTAKGKRVTKKAIETAAGKGMWEEDGDG